MVKLINEWLSLLKNLKKMELCSLNDVEREGIYDPNLAKEANESVAKEKRKE